MIVVRESVFTYPDEPIWEHAVATPSPALKSLVRPYSGYYQDLAQPVCCLQVPSAQVILVLGFGDNLRIRSIGSSPESGEMYQSFVFGLEAQRLLREHDGERHCIGIPLPPWAAYRLFRGASTEFTKKIIALEDIWGKNVNLLIEQLSEMSSWSQRFSLIERVLLDKFAASNRIIRPEIRWAWNQLELQGGCISIRQLAQMLGWSDRHFAKCFRKQIGITPKAAARQIRFTQAHRLLTSSDKYALSEIALACGYSDQSHFTREFHLFSGCSPTNYQKAPFSNLLDISGDIVNK